MFKTAQTKNVNLRGAIITYLESKEGDTGKGLEKHPPEYSLKGPKSIFSQIPLEDLLYLTVYDIKMQDSHWLSYHIAWAMGRGVVDATDEFLDCLDLPGRDESFYGHVVVYRDIWQRLLDNQPYTDVADFQTLPTEVKAYLAKSDTKSKILERYHRAMLQRLGDSVSCFLNSQRVLLTCL